MYFNKISSICSNINLICRSWNFCTDLLWTILTVIWYIGKRILTIQFKFTAHNDYKGSSHSGHYWTEITLDSPKKKSMCPSVFCTTSTEINKEGRNPCVTSREWNGRLNGRSQILELEHSFHPISYIIQTSSLWLSKDHLSDQWLVEGS